MSTLIGKNYKGVEIYENHAGWRYKNEADGLTYQKVHTNSQGGRQVPVNPNDPEFLVVGEPREIFSGEYFVASPDKVLGEIITHNPNTGRELTDQFGKPRPEVRGTMAEAMARIKAPVAKRYDHFFDATVLPVRAPEKKTGRIAKVIAQSKAENTAKQDRGYSCSTNLQCLEETIEKYNPGISREEIEVWVTYQAGQGLYDRSVIDNNEWGKYLIEEPNYQAWHQAGLVAYDGQAYIPQVLYYSGNIYDKIVAAKASEAAIVSEIGEEGYREQLQRLEAAKPKALYLTDDESQKLFLSPFDKIWQDIEITELADGTQVDPKTSISSIFYSEYLKNLSREELTLEKKSTTAWEIYQYWIKKERRPRGKNDSEWASIRRNVTLIGSHHFDQFLLNSLTEEDKAKIAYLWNRKSNNYQDIDYSRIPVGFRMGTMFKGGSLSIRPAQREGVAFMNHRGTGIVAYDVGVGKTMTAILGISDGFEKGLFKRPLVVVPQKVYNKWIAEIIGVKADKIIKQKGKVIAKPGDIISEGILPHIEINDYDNLGVNFISRAVDENGVAKTVAEYSVTMVTYEGLMKIGFNPNTEKDLAGRLKAMLSQGESGRAAAIVEQKAEEWVDAALAETELDIEEMGIDAIIVDETHNFRNLFMEVKGDVGEDGEREAKHFFSGGSGQPSSRALKLFMLNAYVHDNNNRRNTFGLTATPFTNRATEIYSMMAHYDYQGLKDFDVYNIAQFCSKYIDETLESTWTAAGKFEINAVIRGYNNLPSLQSMIFRSINYKTGEEANIQRPEKVILPLTNDENGVPLEAQYMVDTKLTPSTKQEYWLKQIQLFASKDRSVRSDSVLSGFYPEDEKGNVPGQVLIALNASRTVTFSPYALRLGGDAQSDLSKVTPEEFVDGSPKIKYVCECIRTVKQYHEAQGTPVSGQIIYADRGTEWFGHIKQYLVENVGYADKEVAIFYGKVSKGRRETIKEGFLDGKIKIIIGSSTMREGVDLQKFGTVLYNCFLDWNPTDHHQLMGRIWRFGNKFSHVRIVVPLMENSSDIFTWQKLSEKMSRLNSIWTRSGKSKLFEEKELNAEELKRGLINDPEEIVRWELEEQASVLQGEFEIAVSNRDALEQAKELKDKFARLQTRIEELLAEITTRPDVEYSTTPEQLEGLQAMESGDIRAAYRKLYRYAQLQGYYSRLGTRSVIDEHKKYVKRIKNIEDKLLAKEQLTIFDDFTALIDRYHQRASTLLAEITHLKSPEHKETLLAKVIEEKEAEAANRRPVSERVNEFQRLNYLLDCHHKVHTCDIYGRVEEISSGKAVPTIKQPERKLETDTAFKYQWPALLKKFMPKAQQAAVRDILRETESAEGYAKTVLDPLHEQVKSIPKLYATESVPTSEKIIYAHFFQGSSDWYIAEYDPKDNLAFGYAILGGDELNAEWGYVSIDEISQSRLVELDFYWQPVPFASLFGEKEAPAIEIKVDEVQIIEQAIEALQVAMEFSQGPQQVELQEAIDALSVAIEFL
ncbi:helicase-related protein [Lewinella sp. LCG006]|uniref:helicase-related protein n=1 Tax=Lewinella sp. LCG006 TaxID=3231911 RepID=UPI00346134F3